MVINWKFIKVSREPHLTATVEVELINQKRGRRKFFVDLDQCASPRSAEPALYVPDEDDVKIINSLAADMAEELANAMQFAAIGHQQ
jgi:hypothetical protein